MKVTRIAVTLSLAAATLVAGWLTTAAPAQAAPPCWTSFSDTTPAPGQYFQVTYRNCTSAAVTVTPFRRAPSDGTTWVYGACGTLGAWSWDSWTVRAPGGTPVNFGVGTCSSERTYPELIEVYVNDDRCWTHFWPPSPGTGRLVTHWYVNCTGSTVRVAPGYREPDGDMGFYLYDGCASLREGPYESDELLGYVWAAVKWEYRTPSVPSNLTTVYCVSLP